MTPAPYGYHGKQTVVYHRTNRFRPQPIKTSTPDLIISARSDADGDIDFLDVLEIWSAEKSANKARQHTVLDLGPKKNSPLPPIPTELGETHPSALHVAATQRHLHALESLEPRRASSLPSPFCAWPTPRSSVNSAQGSHASAALAEESLIARTSRSSAHQWNENIEPYDWIPPNWIRDVLGVDDSPDVARISADAQFVSP